MAVGWEASRARWGTAGGSRSRPVRKDSGSRILFSSRARARRVKRSMSSSGGRYSQTIVGSPAIRRVLAAQAEG